MATLIDVKGDPDFEVKCSECEVVFTLIWARGLHVGVQYCPFCGDEFEVDRDGRLSEGDEKQEPSP